jgi:hypothetical protein
MRTRTLSSGTQFSVFAAGLFIAVPAVIFYVILLRHLVNAPMNDDYYALLNFCNHLADLPNLPAKMHYFLISQHNEYKLFFEHALFWMQLEFTGHLDLAVLCVIGDGFVLLLALLLWKMFLPFQEDLATRLTLFIPISWLLFQLQYAQTLNFAMGALQNLPVLLFSLGTIYLLFRGSLVTFFGGVAGLVLAVASSGNGLLMIPIGFLVLASERKYKRLFVWTATSLVCLAAYFYAYDPLLWLAPPGTSLASITRLARLYYVICFLGGAGGYPVRAGSVVLGCAICVFYAYIARRGYFKKQPAIGYIVLFLLLTSVGVAGIRSNFGVIHSLSSRYTIYSTLLLIFAWMAIVEEWLMNERLTPWKNRLYLGATVAALLFSVAMDVWGQRFLVRRDRDLIIGMSLYQHRLTQQPAAGPIFPPPKSEEEQTFNLRARDILNRSAQLGIYRPSFY